MRTDPVIVERVFDAPVSQVWKAITDENEMKEWYFDLPGFRAEEGYEFEFFGGKDPSNPYRHLCRIIEVIPQQKISYSWRYDGYAGDSLVTFELFDEQGKTRLRLTHSGLHTFPENNADLAKENFVEGWKAIIHESLKAHLDKRS